MDTKYKRVLIKLSGEALAGSKGFGLDPEVLNSISQEIKEIHKKYVEIAIVVGGGNFWRGRYTDEMDQSNADYMGMIATIINGLALQDTFSRNGINTIVQSSLAINTVCDQFKLRNALKELDNKNVVIFVGGTGNPFFTTDTAAVLRAIEIKADAILLAKNVDAVYNADPKEDRNAIRFDQLKYDDLISKDLKVMDQAAVILAKENNLKIQVFGLNEPDSLLKVISGKKIGTIIE